MENYEYWDYIAEKERKQKEEWVKLMKAANITLRTLITKCPFVADYVLLPLTFFLPIPKLICCVVFLQLHLAIFVLSRFPFRPEMPTNLQVFYYAAYFLRLSLKHCRLL